jgi:hypothetical protein
MRNLDMPKSKPRLEEKSQNSKINILICSEISLKEIKERKLRVIQMTQMTQRTPDYKYKHK